MADFGALDNFLAEGHTFTVGKKHYTAPLMSGAVVLWLDRVDREAAKTGAKWIDAADALAARGIPSPIGKDSDLTAEEAILGPALVAQMAADGLPYDMIASVAKAVYVFTRGADEEIARAVARGEDPNPQGPANRAERRAATKRSRASASQTTSTAAAPTTRPRASGSGTSSRKATGRA